MTQSKADEITTLLRTEILRGQYRPGERLPSERDLAARFEANRSSVREAIKKLEQLGIADVQPGGVRVVAVEDASLDVLGYLLALDKFPQPALIEQLFEVLGVMISLSVRSAVTTADDEQLKQMTTQIHRIRAAINTPPQYHQQWRELSALLGSINRNLVLKLVSNGLKTQFVGRMENLGMVIELDTGRDLDILARLERAIASRNSDAAGAVISEHFDLLRHSVLQALETSTPNNRSASHA